MGGQSWERLQNKTHPPVCNSRQAFRLFLGHIYIVQIRRRWTQVEAKVDFQVDFQVGLFWLEP